MPPPPLLIYVFKIDMGVNLVLGGRAALRMALGLWLRCAARLLGMADYLLPAPPAPAGPPNAPPALLLLGDAGDAAAGGAVGDGAQAPPAQAGDAAEGGPRAGQQVGTRGIGEDF